MQPEVQEDSNDSKAETPLPNQQAVTTYLESASCEKKTDQAMGLVSHYRETVIHLTSLNPTLRHQVGRNVVWKLL